MVNISINKYIDKKGVALLIGGGTALLLGPVGWVIGGTFGLIGLYRTINNAKKWSDLNYELQKYIPKLAIIPPISALNEEDLKKLIECLKPMTLNQKREWLNVLNLNETNKIQQANNLPKDKTARQALIDRNQELKAKLNFDLATAIQAEYEKQEDASLAVDRSKKTADPDLIQTIKKDFANSYQTSKWVDSTMLLTLVSMGTVIALGPIGFAFSGIMGIICLATYLTKRTFDKRIKSNFAKLLDLDDTKLRSHDSELLDTFMTLNPNIRHTLIDHLATIKDPNERYRFYNGLLPTINGYRAKTITENNAENYIRKKIFDYNESKKIPADQPGQEEVKPVAGQFVPRVEVYPSAPLPYGNPDGPGFENFKPVAQKEGQQQVGTLEPGERKVQVIQNDNAFFSSKQIEGDKSAEVVAPGVVLVEPSAPKMKAVDEKNVAPAQVVAPGIRLLTPSAPEMKDVVSESDIPSFSRP